MIKWDLFKFRHSVRSLYFRFLTKYWYGLFMKRCGKGSIIMDPFHVSLNNLILGDHVLIFDFARIESVKNYEGKRFNPVIIFHDHVQIQQGLHLTCAEKIEIGSNTSIGAFVTITDIHHPYEDVSIPIEKQHIRNQSVIIGEDCKIYNNSVILPGSKIGKHCTIGANTVVSGTFPDYCVIVGAPAKIVKRYSFDKEKWEKTDPGGNFL